MLKIKLTASLIALALSLPVQADLVEVVDTDNVNPNSEVLDVKQTPKKKEYDSITYSMPKTRMDLKKDIDYEYLQLNITKSNRLEVLDDGTIVFTVLPTTLEQNARDLLGHTKGANLYVDQHFPKALRMYNSFQLQGDDVLYILDQMIAPFYDSKNVIGEYHKNNVVHLKIGN